MSQRMATGQQNHNIKKSNCNLDVHIKKTEIQEGNINQFWTENIIKFNSENFKSYEKFFTTIFTKARYRLSY